MKILWSPLIMDSPVKMSMRGDVLTIDDEKFDFSSLLEGATLPREAVLSSWFRGPVDRVNGELSVVLCLPCRPTAPESTLFPEPMIVDRDGPIPMPEFDSPKPEEHMVNGE